MCEHFSTGDAMGNNGIELEQERIYMYEEGLSDTGGYKAF